MVGLLGQVIKPIATPLATHDIIGIENADKYSCLEWRFESTIPVSHELKIFRALEVEAAVISLKKLLQMNNVSYYITKKYLYMFRL
jgi:hypothetical protein